MRIILSFFILLSAGPAQAHIGHIGELAGHGHLLGLGALAAAAALAAAMRARRRREEEEPIAEEAPEEEAQPA